MNLLHQNIIETIKHLNLPRGEWCIVGGASLALRGIRECTADVDILVTDRLFEAASEDNTLWLQALDYRSATLANSDPPITLLPFSNFLHRGVSDKVFANSTLEEDLPTITVQDMLSWKVALVKETEARMARLAKDQQDITLLTEYLNK